MKMELSQLKKHLQTSIRNIKVDPKESIRGGMVNIIKFFSGFINLLNI